MGKEILLYGDIQVQTAKDFVNDLEAASGEDITVRVNTPGGEPEHMWAMIGKFKEHEGKKEVKLDGMAYSGGTFFPCYADTVQCYDTTKFLLHRCAYASWLEQNPDWFTEPMRLNLQQINDNLETAFRNKVDVKLFEELTNCKLKDVFSMDSRLDVFFDAKVAKKVGLVDKVFKITPEKQAALNTNFLRAVAKYTGYNVAPKSAAKPEEVTKTSENLKTQNMNVEELKAKHPELFNSIYANASKEGAEKERERVKTAMVFHDVDPKEVMSIIESGKEISSSQMAEFNRKVASGVQAKNIESDSSKTVKTTEELANEESAKKAELAAAEKEIRKNLGKK